jgi:hypothetical protein
LPKDSNAPSFIRELSLQCDSEKIVIDFDDPENIVALEQLVDAILLYIQDDEKREVESMTLELRLTDPRDWVRESTH